MQYQRQDNYGHGFGVRSYQGPQNFRQGGSSQYRVTPKKKRSGSKTGTYVDKKGNSVKYVNGWNASRRYGLCKFFATPTKGTKDCTSQSGKQYRNWMVKYSIGQYGAEQTTTGFYEVATGKVRVPDLGLVMNPAMNYCGKSGKPKNR